MDQALQTLPDPSVEALYAAERDATYVTQTKGVELKARREARHVEFVRQFVGAQAKPLTAAALTAGTLIIFTAIRRRF